MDKNFGFKRKAFSPDQTKNFKRKRSNEKYRSILDLSNCTLLHILKYLDSTSLFQLGKTCTKMKQLVADETLWIHADARQSPNGYCKASYCWSKVHRRTRSILLAGSRRSQVLISLDKLIFSRTLQNLTVLALENQYIKYCTLKDFPKTIQELSFRRSFIAQQMNFFRYSHDTMANLRTLILDQCQWILACCFVSICKYPKLEILSLYMCKKLGDDDMASIGIAGHYGFPSIKVIDLRFTDIGDAFIRTFYKSKTLQVIYLQSFIATYYTERWLRKQDIRTGKGLQEPCYVSDDEANDLSMESLQKRFKSQALHKYSSEAITDNTVRVFQILKPNENISKPKSSLYVYPYQDCICNNKGKHTELYSIKKELPESVDDGFDSSEDEESVYLNQQGRDGIVYMIPDGAYVCNRIDFDSCLAPEWSQKQSTPDYCRHKWLFAREPRNEHEIDMLEHTDKHFKARMALRAYKDTETCGEPNCGCSRNTNNERVIILARNDNGRMFPVRPDGEPPKEFTEKQVNELIRGVAKYIEKIRDAAYPDTDIISILSLILNTVDNHIETDFSDDSVFMCNLRVALTEFVKCVKHKVFYVLTYHHKCFQTLLCQLQYHKATAVRKRLLETFFKNLMHSERPVNDNNLNLPGPSRSTCRAKSPNSWLRTKEDKAEDKNMETRERKEVEQFLDSLTMFVIRRNLFDNINAENDEPALDEVVRFPLPLNGDDVVIQVVQQQAAILSTYIKEISLRGYRSVTDKSLQYLNGLNLNLLDVTGTSVTVKGLRNFMLYNPNCRIIHKSACTCRPKLHF